jgi:hypothetical protein
MRVTRCKLKTIVKGTGVYHEKRWNVQKTIRMCGHKKTTRHFPPSRSPVFSPPVACQVCS